MSNESQNADFTAALAAHPAGRGLRPAFEALWHLSELKVVDDLSDFSSDAWDIAEVESGKKKPVVVVMDTPMDVDHPNLEPNVDRARMRDFSVFNDGAFPIEFDNLEQDEKELRTALAAVLGSSRDMQSGNATTVLYKVAAAVVSEIRTGESGAETNRPWSRPRHTLVKQVPGAHGTAVAGLIAGVPAKVPVQTASYFGATNESSSIQKASLPYAGINPFASIVPISLTAAPYPDMVLGALTYIEALQPDVIVIAAAWADAVDLQGAAPNDSTWPMTLNEHGMNSTENCVPGEHSALLSDTDLWMEVTEKLKSLSHRSVILCAAGNTDSEQLVYPASLAAENDNKIWAVTACDTNGDELSYAPRLDMQKRMIKTLSTQLPRADKGETVTDPYEFVLPELNVKHIAFENVTPRDIITLDPSGRQGYNPTEYPATGNESQAPLLEIGSLYTRFSGTSAATAIAGGLVSLALLTSASAKTGASVDREAVFDLNQAQALFSRG